MPMMKELETVVLTKDDPDHHLKRGDVGTIVHIHPAGPKDPLGGGFEVEFVTLDGETIGVLSLDPSDIRRAEKGPA